MKKFLPILLLLFTLGSIILSPGVAYAQNTTPAPVQNQPGGAPTPIAVPTGGLWVVDPEVTFIGKNAARAGLMLDWALQNYNWVCVTKIADRQCDNSKNPLAQFWGLIVLYIVVPMLFVVILATAIVIIITRGKSLTIMRFIPRFVAVILLIVFSYSILQFLYQFTDLIQGFFLRSANNPCPPDCISQKDLLYVGWDYRSFIGLRLLGDYNAESAFISLLLTKLTALTYFVMVGILLMRKIILWFFIIVSPIFPLLLLYYPVRNTGKIWIGEFFRWLLYAPLFAIFLKGLVFMWRNQIPLVFSNPNIGNPSKIIFPTAVNILLGGPRQFVTPTNSVNLTETFSLYVVALIMLWIVILLPWILLQIFLDYASNFTPGDSAMMKNMVNLIGNKVVPPPSGGGYGPQPPGGAGAAVSLPFAKKFNIPVTLSPNYKPTGAAKEIKAENVQINSRFAQPISMPTAQVNAEVLSIANMSLPNMRDIAKYETALLSKDVSQQREVSQSIQTLEKIANPVAVASTVEREKYVEIHERLERESQQGNMVATSVLNAANVASRNSMNANTTQLKNALTQIANPASVTSTVDREKLTKLHDSLAKESKENNSSLASSILSVSQTSTDKEIEKIKESLMQATSAGNSIANSVASHVNNVAQQAQATTQIKNVVQQIQNPASVRSPVDKEKFNRMNNELQQQAKQGSDLATSILSVNSASSKEEVDKLKDKLMKAKEEGSPIATQLLNMVPQTTQAALPAVNRIQTVDQKEYDDVKKMWKENYHNLQVPEGMAASRTDWMKDDIEKIDSIVDLLSSSDQEKINEGMDQVSNILPFLLVGGFSQTEIVAYLKAKQEAAKETLEEVTKEEEETTVSVQQQHATGSSSMAASMEESSSPSNANVTPSSNTTNESEESSPLENIQNTTINQQEIQVSNDILQMVNVKVPRMRDIARYETLVLKNDKQQLHEVEKMHEVLQGIANPTAFAPGADRERYEKLKQKLMDESQKGNNTANVILSAANSSAQAANKSNINNVLQQIANPATANEKDKEKFSKLHEQLTQASQQGNKLATSILAVKDSSSPAELEALKKDLTDAKQKGEPLAKDILSTMPAVTLPATNTVQTVSNEEYDEVKKMWKENYQNLQVPQGMAGTRESWIKEDISKIENVVDLLNSPEADKQEIGLHEVSNILPFLLIGGFSKTEIVAYLKAKLQGAKDALESTKKEEEETTISSEKKEEKTENQTMAATIEDNPAVAGTEQQSKTAETTTQPTNTSSEGNEGGKQN